jgi:hypothetical protein
MYLGVSSVTPVSRHRTNLPCIIVILNPGNAHRRSWHDAGVPSIVQELEPSTNISPLFAMKTSARRKSLCYLNIWYTQLHGETRPTPIFAYVAGNKIVTGTLGVSEGTKEVSDLSTLPY